MRPFLLSFLAVVLAGCYDFGALSTEFGNNGGAADRTATADDGTGGDGPSPVADLTTTMNDGPPPLDFEVAPPADFTGVALDLTPLAPDLVPLVVDLLQSPPDLLVPIDMARPPADFTGIALDLIAPPPDFSVNPPDLSINPPDLKTPSSDLVVSPSDLRSSPDLAAIAVSCSDGVKNGGETDIDCGGPCPGCGFGKMCKQGGDCQSTNCVGGTCQLPVACSNGTKDGQETDVDCGGPVCGKCANGKKCSIHADCQSVTCTAGLCGTGMGLKLSFAPPVKYALAVGASPDGLAAGDLDGDGQIDLATAGNGLNTVSVLGGNVNGTFKMPVTYPTGAGSSPQGLVLADFNGDKKLDMATANAGNDGLSVFVNTGTGFTMTPYTVATGAAPYALAAADLTGDTKPDLVTVNAGATFASLFVNSGTGSFKAPKPIAGVGGSGQSIAIGDLNGDNQLDLAIARIGGANTISIVPGNGNGTFQALTTYAVMPAPYFVTLADLNGDHQLDLAVADNAGFSNGYCSVLLGNGNATFQPPQAFASANSPVSLAVADFNKDGKLDLAIANENISTVRVALGNGDGTFQPPNVYYLVGMTPSTIVAADFNNDQKTDLAVSCYGDDTIHVLLNTSQ